jgi:heme/copper-type cytochrome/quinol oxidase subunit 2
MDLMTAGLPSEFPWWVAAGVMGGVILALGGVLLRRRSPDRQEPPWAEPVFLGWLVLIICVLAITGLGFAEKEIPDLFIVVVPLLTMALMWSIFLPRR